MRSNLPLPSSRSCSALAVAGALVTAVSPGLASAVFVSAGLPSAADLAPSPGWAVSVEGADLASGLASPPADWAAWPAGAAAGAAVESEAAVGLASPAGFSAELLAGAAVSCGLLVPAGVSFEAFCAGSDTAGLFALSAWGGGGGVAPAVGSFQEPANIPVVGSASRRAMAVQAKRRSTRIPGIANSPSQPARSEALLLDDDWPQFMAET